MTKYGVVKGIKYIMVRIKIYLVQKQIFMIDFESGKEVLIPPELRQDDLSISLKYYDPILAII